MPLKNKIFDSALAWARRNPAAAAMAVAMTAILAFSLPALPLVGVLPALLIAGGGTGVAYFLGREKRKPTPATPPAPAQPGAPAALAGLPDLGQHFRDGSARDLAVGRTLKFKPPAPKTILPGPQSGNITTTGAVP